MTTKEAEAIIRSRAILIREKYNRGAIIGIDGRCASGKTTWSMHMAQEMDTNLIHMDDFYLRPEQRTADRYEEPGGNVDRERIISDVMIPLIAGKLYEYNPYDAHGLRYLEAKKVDPDKLTIIEGAYALHPELRKYYDLTICMTIDSKEQMHRIIKRDGLEKAKMFEEKWIPLEEKYISYYGIIHTCDILIDDDDELLKKEEL